MDLIERIARRRLHRSEGRLVADWDALAPVAHLDEPVGRESVVEALLDALDPLFDGVLPPNVYVWGPSGAGKSAIVTALASALDVELAGRRTTIPTTTRAEYSREEFHVVFLDARVATSRFQVYRRTLDAIADARIPERGIGTDQLRRRLEDELIESDGALVAVDHLDEPASLGLADVRECFDPLDDVSWIGVGRQSPQRLPENVPGEHVHVPPYGLELEDVLTVRGARGLSHGLDHRHARRLAEWADGNAHDALAALFTAAVVADADGATRLRGDHVDAGIKAVPRNGVPVGRVLALPETEQLVLERLRTAADRETTIDVAAGEIASRSDLTRGTVKRLLYELAQAGVLERVRVPVGRETAGRHPSCVVPQFSMRAFEQLRERER